MEKNCNKLNDEQLEKIVGGNTWDLYPTPADGTCPRCRSTRLERRNIICQIPYCVQNCPYCPSCGVGYIEGVSTLTEIPVVSRNGDLYLVL